MNQQFQCPHCRSEFETATSTSKTNVVCSTCGSSFSVLASQETIDLRPDSRRISHFELLAELGSGSFGTVWKARDTKLERYVAIKIPHDQHGLAEEKFFQEAQVMAKLRHPNIVGVHEIGKHQKSLYIVSDLVDGVSLADLLTSRRHAWKETVEILQKVARAIHFAHQRGVIHRDLKPSNIMMNDSAEPVVMDFGLAKRDAGEISLSSQGAVLGTPAYMPPEQARGDGHLADARSDIYSLGVILFEMITGELPFRGNPTSVIHQVLEDEPPAARSLNPAIPIDLETISQKCMQKSPQARYATMELVADEFARYLQGKPIVARPINQFQKSIRWFRRNLLVGSLAAVTLLAILISMAVIHWEWKKTAHATNQLIAAKQKIVAATEASDAASIKDLQHLVDLYDRTCELQLIEAESFADDKAEAKSIALGKALDSLKQANLIMEQLANDSISVGAKRRSSLMRRTASARQFIIEQAMLTGELGNSYAGRKVGIVGRNAYVVVDPVSIQGFQGGVEQWRKEVYDSRSRSRFAFVKTNLGVGLRVSRAATADDEAEQYVFNAEDGSLWDDVTIVETPPQTTRRRPRRRSAEPDLVRRWLQEDMRVVSTTEGDDFDYFILRTMGSKNHAILMKRDKNDGTLTRIDLGATDWGPSFRAAILPGFTRLALASFHSANCELWDIESGKRLASVSTSGERYSRSRAQFFIDGDIFRIRVGPFPVSFAAFHLSDGSPAPIVPFAPSRSFNYGSRSIDALPTLIRTESGIDYVLNQRRVSLESSKGMKFTGEFEIGSDGYFRFSHNTAGAWDLESGKYLRKLPASRRVGFDPTKRWCLAWNDIESSLALFDLTGEQRPRPIRFPNYSSYLLPHTQVSPHGDRLAVDIQGMLILWDSEKDRLVKACEARLKDGIHLACFNREAGLMAAIGDGGGVVVRDAETGTLKSSWPMEGMVDWGDKRPPVDEITFSPDGSRLLSRLGSGNMELRLTTGEVQWILTPQPKGWIPVHVAFHPAGEHLLVVDDRARLLILRVEDGTVEGMLDSPAQGITSLAVCQKSGKIGLGTQNGEVYVWTEKQGFAKFKIDQAVSDLTFCSPNLLALASGNSVRLFDVTSRDELFRFRPSQTPVAHLDSDSAGGLVTAVVNPESVTVFSLEQVDVLLTEQDLSDKRLTNPHQLEHAEVWNSLVTVARENLASTLTKWTSSFETSLNEGKLDIAERHLSNSISFQPADVQLRIRRATLLGQTNQWTELIRDVDSIPDHQQNAASRLLRGTAKNRLGQWDFALQDLSNATKQDSKNAECWLQRGVAHVGLKRWDEALSELNRCLAIEPDNYPARLYHALCQTVSQRYEDAIAACDVLIKSDDTASARYLRAICRSELKEWSTAMEDLAVAIELTDGNATLHQARGDFFYRQGNEDRAMEEYKKSFQKQIMLSNLEPANELTQMLLCLASREIRLSQLLNRYSILLIKNQRRKEYQTLCGTLMTNGWLNSEVMFASLWIQCLAQNSISNRQSAREISRLRSRSMAARMGSSASSFHSIYAAWMFRRRDYETAHFALNTLTQVDQDGGTVWNWLLLAMTEHRMGDLSKAELCLQKVDELIQAGQIDPRFPNDEGDWSKSLQLQLLHEEARKLIQTQEAAGT